MPVFPSKAWCEEAARLLEADAELGRASQGWVGDFGLVVEAEAGKLAKSFVVYCKPDGPRIGQLKILADPDDLDELEPAYRIRAPYTVWKGLIQGAVDPIEAVLRRRIAVEGELQPLMERMRYRGIAERVLARLSTSFPDEG